MELSLTQVRVLSIGILIASLTFSPILASATERGTNAGQIMFRLLGLSMAQEPKKIDVNLATVDELRAVPGIQRHQVLRTIAEWPYATLSELGRAGLLPGSDQAPRSVSHVDDDGRSASLSPSIGPDRR